MFAVGETVISPSQLSTAVRSTGGGTSDEHCKFKSAGGAGGTGAVSSRTIIIWLTALVLPQASVKVQVRTIVKSFKQLPGMMFGIGATVISPLQLSTAVRSTGGGTSDAHSKFKSAGGAGGTGAVVSSKISKV